MGTEIGGLLQHTFAQGHNFEGIDPSRKDEKFEEIKRLILGQLAYDFPGSRAYFNYVFSHVPEGHEPADGIFGHVLGLAFPRFSLAPFTGVRHPVSSYFTAAVKRVFTQHYRNGRTGFPSELLLPGEPGIDTLALTLESEAGLSVHMANLSGQDAVLMEQGYSVTLGHGRAALIDSFGNAMGRAQEIRRGAAGYLGFDRPAAFGLWRGADARIYLCVREEDFAPLETPMRVSLSQALLDRLKLESHSPWCVLDDAADERPVEQESATTGLELVYPPGRACRCLAAKNAAGSVPRATVT